MKPRFSTRRNAAMTLFEVGVIIAIVMVLALVLLPMLAKTRRKVSRMGCVNNLKEIGLAYRIWEGDNGDVYPMGISVTNGGSMEMVRTGNVVQTFLVMSNELSTPKILICPGGGYDPGDTNRVYATDFNSLSNSNISYFVGVDVTNDADPKMILSGDCDFEIGRVLVKSGLNCFATNDPVAWSKSRHAYGGNIGLADGSVQQTDDSRLRDLLRQTGLVTNRFAVP